MPVMLGLIALLIAGAVLEPVFGRLGYVILIGVGMPIVLAFHYYRLDIEDRSRRKRDDQIQQNIPTDQSGNP